jgi:hypothetical protein
MNNMKTENLARFKSEINCFFALVLLNLVFGAMAMAFGLQFILSSVLGLTGGTGTPGLRMIIGAISMVCFGLGLGWILMSARILKGITLIRREFKHHTGPVPDETLTCWIIRMIAHYRGNRKQIQNMIVMCTLGGFCFLVLGVLNSLEFFSIGPLSGSISLNGYLLIPSALLTLGIALVSLASSFYFARFSKTWDFRQDEISRSEHELAEKLGRG